MRSPQRGAGLELVKLATQNAQGALARRLEARESVEAAAGELAEQIGGWQGRYTAACVAHHQQHPPPSSLARHVRGGGAGDLDLERMSIEVQKMRLIVMMETTGEDCRVIDAREWQQRKPANGIQ